MKEYQAKLILDAGCALGEGPVYDEAENSLYFVDIEKNRIHCLDFTTGKQTYMQLDRPIGSMVLTDHGGILAGLDDGVYRIDGLRYEPFCTMKESEAPNIRFNDGKCDPAGRYIVGTQVDPNGAKQGCLFSVSADGSYYVISDDLGCSNGLAWSADRKTMYHVDSLEQTPSRIFAFDYDVETGAATNRREIIDFSQEASRGIQADGMTIDQNGNLWIAEWDGYGVGCWNPQTGEKIAWVRVPAEKVTCCTFGGKDCATLYITTAAGGGEYGGGVFTADVEAKGFPSVLFREQDNLKK